MMQGLEVLKKQTHAFIQEDPTPIVLTRHTSTPDGAGGTNESDAPLAPQTMRIVQTEESNTVERTNNQGEVVRPQLRIVAEVYADIIRGDTFVWQGMNCEVVWVMLLQYEKIADVAVQ
jgi:hypothetical protein